MRGFLTMWNITARIIFFYIVYMLQCSSVLSENHVSDLKPFYSYDNAIYNLHILATEDNLNQHKSILAKYMIPHLNHLNITHTILYETYMLDDNCERDINVIKHKLLNGSLFGLEWLDAIGHIPPGILGGAINWPGSFELCMSIPEHMRKENISIQSKYCSMSLVNVTQRDLPMNLRIGINTAFCLPRSCNADRIYQSVNKTVTKFGLKVDQAASYCHTSPEALSTDAWYWGAIVVLIVATLLLLVGSMYELVICITWLSTIGNKRCHLITVVSSSNLITPGGVDEDEDDELLGQADEDQQTDRRPSDGQLSKRYLEHRTNHLKRQAIFLQVLAGFSVPYNTYKLFNSARPSLSDRLYADRNEHPLAFLDGIRVLTMIWIIFGHTVLFSVLIANNLLLYFNTNFHRWTYQVILSGPLAVDTFFMISGLLAVYTALPRFQAIRSLRGKLSFALVFILHRFIRLTPAYLLVMILYTGLFTHLYDGPFYPQRPELTDIADCRSHGWVMYLNNFIYTNKKCMPWTWYLANDFQFSVILAPIFIMLSSLNALFGLLFSMLLLLSSSITTFVISYRGDYPPGLFAGIKDEAEIYVKPYTRWGTYALGMTLGLILINGYKLPQHWSKVKRNLLIWSGLAFSAFLCLSTVYGMYSLVSGEVAKWPSSLSAFYTAAHRPAFILGVAIITYLCATDNTPLIRTVLGWNAFSPIARLTYGAYLVHPIVLFFFILGRQSPILLDNLFLIMQFLSAYVISYLLATLINLVSEAPILNLEKVFKLR